MEQPVLFFHAPWCPFCKAQEPKVKAHLNGAHKNVVAFKVDSNRGPTDQRRIRVLSDGTVVGGTSPRRG